MSRTCPACSGAMIGHGSVERTVLDAERGSLVRRQAQQPRLICKACGTTRSVGADITGAARETIAQAHMRSGARAAGERLGIDRSIVQRVFDEWRIAAERELPQAMPDALGLHIFVAGRHERIVAFDAVEQSVLEVFDSHAAAREWLSERAGRTTLALIDLDARSSMLIREILPDAEVAIAPSLAEQAVADAALAVLDALRRRSVAAGSNFEERRELLLRQDDELGLDELDELSAWSKPARHLRRTTLDILSAIAKRSSNAFEAVVDHVVRLGLPEGALGRLIATWRREISAGLRLGWVDEVFEKASEIGRRAAVLRSRPGLEPLRSLILLSSGPDRRMLDVLRGPLRPG